MEEDDLKSCLNKFYECKSIRLKILSKNNPALIRITRLIEETEKFIRAKIEIVINENQVNMKKTEENASHSVDFKEKNFDSTTLDSNTNGYKSNLTFYSNRSEPEKAKENQKKIPKFIDFKG